MGWRENELLDVLGNKRLKTGDLVERSNMSKTTALKYLESLRARGRVGCEMIGPTKLWFRTGAKQEADEADLPVEGRYTELERHIYVDKRVLGLLEEFERVTGVELNILVDKNGMRLIFGEVNGGAASR